ncbi:hypothetical protein B4P02_27525, partial [Escherichia coli]
NAAKPGRRRYLTLVMIFITVVICYVDRANLAVASAHIQEEFGPLDWRRRLWLSLPPATGA